jgi:hypothetical protein
VARKTLPIQLGLSIDLAFFMSVVAKISSNAASEIITGAS